MAEVKLKVMEALQEEAYKGIVRIDSETMKEIGVHPGDVLEIEGSRITVGIVDRAYPTDVGQSVIRMDGIIRRNAKTGIGENIKVRKADVKEAKSVIIAPAQKNVMVRANPDIFKKSLLGRAILKGDILVPGGARLRRRSMSDSPFFEDVFSPFEDSFMSGFGLGNIRFIVVSTNPKDAVLITENTQLTLNPKAVEETEEKIPEVTYEDIGGLKEEITKIREMVELPLKHPDLFRKLGIEPPAGVLLHGPPGTGKTLLAKAVANESEANFILVNGPEIVNKFYGESEKRVREIFEQAEKSAPSIIFFDEFDAIASKREESYGELERRVVSQILTQMDGLKSRGRVVVIAATNRPNSIDPALRRPGRFDREVAINVPNKEGRLNVLKIHTRNMPLQGEIYPDILKNKFNNEFGELVDKCDLEIIQLSKDEKKTSEKIKTLQIDINQQKKELINLNEELKELKSKLNSESLIQSLINKINSLKYNIKKLGEEISEKESTLEKLNNSLKDYANEIKKLNSKKIKINKLKEELSLKKVLVNKILNELIRIYSLKEFVKSLEFDDPRKILIGNLGLKENEDKLFNQLFDLEIISDSLINKTRQEGIPRILTKLSEITHGFVGADLAALCKEAAMNVLRRILPDLKLGEKTQIPEEIYSKLKITQKDFDQALRLVRPSAMREVLIEKPNVKWVDVGGLAKLKQELIEAVEWPLKHRAAFKRLGIKPPSGLLLYGPPGTGKTLLAKAVANESEANFILVRGPELLNKYVGESEKGVRKVFERARQTAPTIIFFDEIDSLAPKRGLSSDSQTTERVVNTMLSEMDGLEELNDVVVIAATNRPDIIDAALLRPGRFDRFLLTVPPILEGRKEIFKIHTKEMPLAKDVDLNKLAEKTEGYVGADIQLVCREAGLLALREDFKSKTVKNEFFLEALKKVKPSVSKDVMEEYQKLEEDYLSKTKAGLGRKDIPNYMG